MKKILFSKDGNWVQEMIYSCSYRFDPKTSPKFIQEADCVVNADSYVRHDEYYEVVLHEKGLSF